MFKKLTSVVCFAGLSVSSSVIAQADFPNKPVRVVVPYATGGSTDVISRIVAQRLGERLGQPVVVENKAGANAMIGTEFVAKSKPDGYTLLAASSGNAANVTLFKGKADNFPRDFVPIVGIAFTPNVFAVSANSTIQSLDDVIKVSTAKPGSLSYAHAGIGSLQHLVGEQFKLAAKVRIVDVPYKGGGPATADVVGGQVPILVSGLTASIGFVNAGRLRPLAVSSAQRSASLPNVPTVAESGFPGFSNVFWVALYAPAGTPTSVINRVNRDVNEILKQPEVLAQLRAQAADPLGGSAQDLDTMVKKDIEIFSKVITDANIKIQ